MMKMVDRAEACCGFAAEEHAQHSGTADWPEEMKLVMTAAVAASEGSSEHPATVTLTVALTKPP